MFGAKWLLANNIFLGHSAFASANAEWPKQSISPREDVLIESPFDTRAIRPVLLLCREKTRSKFGSFDTCEAQ